MEYTMTPPAAQSVEITGISIVAYAGFWRRFIALVLDWLIIGAVFMVFAFIFGVGMWGGRTPNDPTETRMFAAGMSLLWFIELAVGWLYFAWMESSDHQGTLGKMALGLKVTDLDGKRISFGRATGRYFAKFLSGVVLFIGYIMAAFTPKKQAMHDMIASTLVLSKQATVPAQVAQNAYATQG